MKGLVLVTLFIVVTVSLLFAGWERTYGGSDYDDAMYIIPTSTNGFMFAGNTSSFSDPLEDIYVVTLNANGDTIRTRTYGGSDYDYSTIILPTIDNGYVIGGGTWSYGIGTPDYQNMYLIKISSTGTLLWSQNYGDSLDDFINSMTYTTSGGYMLVGARQYPDPDYDLDIYVVKTNANGDTLRTDIYGGYDDDYATSITQSPDGGHVIVGATSSVYDSLTDPDSTNVIVFKLDSADTIVWFDIYGGDRREVPWYIANTTDGGYIVAGWSNSYSAGGDPDVYLLRLDSAGDIVWTRTYGGSKTDIAFSVHQTTDGGFIVAGYTFSFPRSALDSSANIYLIKTNANGDTLWTRTYGGNNNDVAYSMFEKSAGIYVIAGMTASLGDIYGDAYLIKTDSLGSVEVKDIFRKPEILDISAYPNPFNSACRIITPDKSDVAIYDILGRLVERIPDGDIIWRPERNVTSGLYFIRANFGDNKLSKKVFYLK